MKKGSLVDAQETAGFFEPNERIVIGSYFNHLFFFSTLNSPSGAEPSGKLKEALEKYFSDYNGFKEAFRKAVASRFQPGWVWLSILPGAEGKLVLT